MLSNYVSLPFAGEQRWFRHVDTRRSGAVFDEYEDLASEHDRRESSSRFVFLLNTILDCLPFLEYEQLLADVGGDSFYIR